MKEDRIKCEFCNREIHKEKLGYHLKNKHKDKFENEVDLNKYFLSKKENMSFEFIERVIKEYENCSVLDIEEKYNFRFRHFVVKLGLKLRSISESRLLRNTQNKQKLTVYNKYGVDNISKNEKIKEKKKETFIKNYGVDNIWKTREYRIWWESEMTKKYGRVDLGFLYGNENSFGWKTITEEDKKKRIKKLNEGYIFWYINLSEDVKISYNKRKTNRIVNLSPSKLEKRIEKILIDNNLKFKTQYWVNQKSFDFCLGNKILLEIQGTYWHCDPRKYKHDDIILFPEKKYLVEEIWERDRSKKIIAEDYGYNVFYLWEDEINNYSDEEILIFIRNIL